MLRADPSNSKIMRNVPARFVWLFLTDRCNFKCDYCFNKYRMNTDVMNFKYLNVIFQSINITKTTQFVISGGEPLLVWGDVERFVSTIRKRGNENTITLETNGTLLGRHHIKFLKAHDVIVEYGLDGCFSSCKYRRGMTESGYDNIRKAIRFCNEQGVEQMATMTVHPGNASMIANNFIEVYGMGINDIEVCPAAFEQWSYMGCRSYVKSYLKLIAFLKQNKMTGVLDFEYYKPLSYALDVLVMPSGMILPNWATLSMKPDDKKMHMIGVVGEDEISWNPKVFSDVLDLQKKISIKKGTYRDLSMLFVKQTYDAIGDEEQYKFYESIVKNVKRVNRAFLGEKIRGKGFEYSPKQEAIAVSDKTS